MKDISFWILTAYRFYCCSNKFLTHSGTVSHALGKHCPMKLAMGDAEKTTDKRPDLHKAGARYAGCLDGDTQQPAPPTGSLLYAVAKQGGAAVLGRVGMTL
jgi:hypothetical protein